MEGYIQNFKKHTEGDKLNFSWYSDLPHSNTQKYTSPSLS